MGSDIEHIVKMANQIAENFSFHEDQVARTADHFKRFWAPSMRRKLAEHVASGGEGVSQPAIRALESLDL